MLKEKGEEREKKEKKKGLFCEFHVSFINQKQKKVAGFSFLSFPLSLFSFFFFLFVSFESRKTTNKARSRSFRLRQPFLCLAPLSLPLN